MLKLYCMFKLNYDGWVFFVMWFMNFIWDANEMQYILFSVWYRYFDRIFGSMQMTDNNNNLCTELCVCVMNRWTIELDKVFTSDNCIYRSINAIDLVLCIFLFKRKHFILLQCILFHAKRHRFYRLLHVHFV